MTEVVLQGTFSIDTFDPAVTNWKRWLQRFEGAVTVFTVPDDQKVAYLLHFIGPVAFDIICDKLSPADPYKQTYANITAKLEDFYAPTPLEIAENYRFHLRKQTEGETIQKHATQLQSGVAKVDYTGSVQVKKPARDKRYNAPTKKAAPTKSDVQSRPASSKTLHTNARAATNVVCFRCGANHLATHCNLDQGIRCRNCGIAGHLAKICKKAKANTKQLEEILLVEHLQHRQGYYVTLAVENTPVKFEVDSGAAVTIISKRMSEQLFPNKVLRYTTLKLQTFCKTIVDIVGMYSVQVRYRNIAKRLNVYVANVDRKPLLGREWIRQLKITLTEEIAHAAAISHNEIDKILKSYQEKLDPTSSKIRGIQARLTLKENANPVFVKARTVPFRLAELITKEIDTLEKEGILEKVNASEWATPIVPVLKKNNTIRICGDFSVTLNKHLVVDEHPLPTIDELFATMAGGDKFSKIDLQHACLQLEIRPEDREQVTLNTHKGLYRCTRLLYGIASAPAIWQRQMENLLRDIPGVSVFIDDIRITAPNDKVHLQRLEQVLTRLGKANIRINTEKSEFFKNSIEYCGYRIDKQGIHKTKTKMDAIDKMPRPRNITELRAFIGFVNYYGRFIENLSSLLFPLYELLSDRVPFKWTKECEKAFLDAKCQFKSNKVLAHFNPQLPLIVATDASSYGVGAILSHKYPDGSERVLQYASQTLSKTQRRYSQIDKEAYAIIFAIKKFHQYLYGNHFTLYTDTPTVSTNILANESIARLQCHENATLRVIPTSNADGLSRLPVRNETDFEYDVVDAHELNSINTLPVTAEEIVKEIETDDKLHKIKVALQSEKLLSAHDRFNDNQTAYSLQQGIIMVNDKVIIPEKLRNRILQELFRAFWQDYALIETAEPPQLEEKSVSSGIDFVDFQHVFKQIIQLGKHSSIGCGVEHFQIIGCQQNGLAKKYKNSDNTMDINRSAVSGTMMTGGGYNQLEEILSGMNVSCMSKRIYEKCQDEIIDAFELAAQREIENAGTLEKELAIARGDMLPGCNIPCIPVVADGSWMKRSYRGGDYNSLSGVGAIVGYHTKKVFYINECQRLAYFCNKYSDPNGVNYVPQLKECGIYQSIEEAMQPLFPQAESLLYGLNNNAVESFNNIIVKFIGGKRINFGLKGSYQGRVSAAVLHFNSRESFSRLSTAMNKEPTAIVQNMEQRPIVRQRLRPHGRKTRYGRSSILF
ncbi:uncharacterized protein LOC143305275 [Osmia lignaria lignaria]|uniref:uncharacterized protein LOC143305275 n=1 Tax=Osmia lignaria lignaria TaxID=1437193 RepID=UPI00402BB17A